MPNIIKPSLLRRVAIILAIVTLLVWEIAYTILSDDITSCTVSKIFVVLAAAQSNGDPLCEPADEVTVTLPDPTPEPTPLPTTVYEAAEQARICPPIAPGNWMIAPILM